MVKVSRYRDKNFQLCLENPRYNFMKYGMLAIGNVLLIRFGGFAALGAAKLK